MLQALRRCICSLPLVVLAGCHDEVFSWGYEGEVGPDFWSELDETYRMCGAGEAQSPIDIRPSLASMSSDTLQFDYRPLSLLMFNNGHTVEIEYADGGMLHAGSQTWHALQFHFHAGSEHTIDGRAFPLEMHVVHQSPMGLAVLGVLFEEGETHEALIPVFSNLPESTGPPIEIEDAWVNLQDVLSGGSAAWRYEGSLTTPPCTEGVEWFVLSQPIQASSEQIGRFTALFDHNYRPTQPLNGRVVSAMP